MEDQKQLSPIEMELRDAVSKLQNTVAYHTQVHEFTDRCWDQCLKNDTLSSHGLESKQETCLSRCVERFLDTGIVLVKKMQELSEKGAR